MRGKLASDRYHLGWAGQGSEGLGLVSPRKASPLLFSTGSWSPAKSADCRATNSWSILRSGIGPPRWPMEDAGPRKRRPHARSGDLTLQGLLQRVRPGVDGQRMQSRASWSLYNVFSNLRDTDRSPSAWCLHCSYIDLLTRATISPTRSRKVSLFLDHNFISKNNFCLGQRRIWFKSRAIFSG